MTLQLESLQMAFGSNVVLQDVNLNLQRGELLCLLGPNGAGKSTLFRCILQLERQYCGRISIDGADLRLCGARRLAKKIAYIPQAHQPVFDYLVEDIVLMGAAGGCAIYAAPGKRERELALRCLSDLGIAFLAGRSYARISGGERQLVLIARALAQQTPFLVMDEPTANLDYGNQVRVLELVAGLAHRGYAVLMSTHNPEQAFLWAQRAAVLNGGRIIADGDPRSILTETMMRELYRVHVRLLDVPHPDLPGQNHAMCMPDAAIRLRQEQARRLEQIDAALGFGPVRHEGSAVGHGYCSEPAVPHGVCNDY